MSIISLNLSNENVVFLHDFVYGFIGKIKLWSVEDQSHRLGNEAAL